jgi:hypothetical protein
MTNKDDEQMKFAFNNMINAASQVADLMFLAVCNRDPFEVEEIAVAINSNRPRYMLQVRAGGIDLVALDEQNRTFGEPLFSYVKEEDKLECIN